MQITSKPKWIIDAEEFQAAEQKALHEERQQRLLKMLRAVSGHDFTGEGRYDESEQRLNIDGFTFWLGMKYAAPCIYIGYTYNEGRSYVAYADAIQTPDDFLEAIHHLTNLSK